MVLVVVILVFCSIAPLQTWDITENDHYDILERWGYSRVKRRYKIEEKFSSHGLLTCDDMDKTDKTPFITIFLYKSSGRFLCFGTLVDHLHVLTIKKCFEKVHHSEVLALVGYFKAYWGKNAQVKKVAKIVRNEYMVALAKLKSPVRFASNVFPTRLPASYTKMEIDFKKVFPGPYKLVGFDVDRYDIPGEFISKELFYELKEDHFVPFDDCKKNFSRLVLDTNRLFCTMGNASACCWGSRGGPVLKWMKDNYFLQVGIILADNCTFDTTGPFLVARTDSFSDWIKSNTFLEKKPR